MLSMAPRLSGMTTSPLAPTIFRPTDSEELRGYVLPSNGSATS